MVKQRNGRATPAAGKLHRKGSKSWQSFELALGRNGQRIEPTAAEIAAAEKRAQIKRENDYLRKNRLVLEVSPGIAGIAPEQRKLL